jgi:heme/copper-type cytochrome/quinol oxidase subunit 3
MSSHASREFLGDLSRLPSHAFGPRSLTWWGQAGLIAIESIAFVLAGGAYLFLMAQEPHWPPNVGFPGLLWSTLFLAVILVSEWPNVRIKQAAEKGDVRTVRRGTLWMVAFGVALIAIRAGEFTALGVRWDDNAYGSIVWALLVLHTTHLVTDFYDTCVLAVLVHGEHGDSPRRLVDMSENALYWHFVVAAWIPLYLLLYWTPRLP